MASASLRPGGESSVRSMNQFPQAALATSVLAACPRRNRTSCEGVIHNHFRAFIGAILCRLGNCSMLRVELMAILHGLRIMKNKSILDRVIVESNSLLVLEIINEACNSNHPALLLQWKLLVSSRKVQGTLLEKEMKG
ncbi:hypothetical protein JHK84_028476 [Glycine max]|nr:hypothetical protein JHK84_028476 [Glycine max]